MTDNMPETIWVSKFLYGEEMALQEPFPNLSCIKYTRTDTISAKLEAAEKMAEALNDLYIFFDKGKRDKFGRLRPTRAQGDVAWFVVSQALQHYRKVIGE